MQTKIREFLPPKVKARMKSYEEMKKELMDTFKEVFPEYEDLPTGHRLLILYSKMKDLFYKKLIEHT